MKDINVEAMESAVDITAREADTKLAQMQSEAGAIREESRALGVLQKVKYDQAHNELLKFAMLYQIRKNKEYKNGGMTWEQFCDAAGENVRNVNRTLKDIKPIYDNFQDNMSCFLEVPLNKIKYLGRSIGENQDNLSQNGELILGEERIPLTPDNKDEIEAAIDTLIESHKTEQKDLKKKLARARKNTDRIIEEETRGLKHERDALVKEVDRLKPLDPEGKDESWSVDLIEEMKDMVAGFTAAANKLIMDERLKEDMHLQAKAEQMILLMNRMTGDLHRTWDDVFNVYEE